MAPGRGAVKIRRVTSVLVGDAMRPGLLGCRAAASLREAALLMASRRVHCVIVRSVGASALLTDLDLTHAVASGRFDRTTAGEAASMEVVTISPDATLEDAARLMDESASTHLVVTGRGTGAPIGVLSTLDLAAALAGLEPPRLQLSVTQPSPKGR
jgi:CBS domain-containing protein